MAIPNDVEPEGGDPPCWAHLFEDETCLETDHAEGVVAPPITAESRVNELATVDLAALIREGTARGHVKIKRNASRPPAP